MGKAWYVWSGLGIQCTKFEVQKFPRRHPLQNFFQDGTLHKSFPRWDACQEISRGASLAKNNNVPNVKSVRHGHTAGK